MLTYLLYIFIGSIAGFISGLLGGGAGLIMMPSILAILASEGIAPELTMHVAIGTAMGSCLILGLTSSFLQYQHRAIVWPAFNRLLLGIIAGTLTGSLLANHIPGETLKWFFAILVFALGAWMILHKEHSKKWTATLPIYLGGSFVSALLNSLVGIATFTVPFLHKCGFDIRNSVGTATPLTFLVSLIGAICFVFTGWHVPNLPPHSWGYVYWPIVIPFSIGSAIFAYIGAQASHRISRTLLKNCYIVLLFIVGIKMLT
jgi:uncharacterized protein